MLDLSLVAVALGVYSLLMTLAVWKLDRLHTKALAMITDLRKETRELRGARDESMHAMDMEIRHKHTEYLRRKNREATERLLLEEDQNADV